MHTHSRRCTRVHTYTRTHMKHAHALARTHASYMIHRHKHTHIHIQKLTSAAMARCSCCMVAKPVPAANVSVSNSRPVSAAHLQPSHCTPKVRHRLWASANWSAQQQGRRCPGRTRSRPLQESRWKHVRRGETIGCECLQSPRCVVASVEQYCATTRTRRQRIVDCRCSPPLHRDQVKRGG